MAPRMTISERRARNEQVLSYARCGFSSRWIAEKVGHGLTRNAVIGICFRAGVLLGKPQGTADEIAERQRKARARRKAREFEKQHRAEKRNKPRPVSAKQWLIPTPRMAGSSCSVDPDFDTT